MLMEQLKTETCDRGQLDTQRWMVTWPYRRLSLDERQWRNRTTVPSERHGGAPISNSSTTSPSFRSLRGNAPGSVRVAE